MKKNKNKYEGTIKSQPGVNLLTPGEVVERRKKKPAY